MKKLNWVGGLGLAAFMAAIQLLLAVGSYVTGCAIFGDYKCSVDRGVAWVLQHPVFPNLAPKLILFGFVVGLFSHHLGAIASALGGAVPQPVKSYGDKHKYLSALVIVVLLAAAFALWGLPEILLLRRSETAGPN